MRLTVNTFHYDGLVSNPVSGTLELRDSNGIVVVPTSTGTTTVWDLPFTAIYEQKQYNITYAYFIAPGNTPIYNQILTLYGYDLTLDLYASSVPYVRFTGYRKPFDNSIWLINTVAFQTNQYLEFDFPEVNIQGKNVFYCQSGAFSTTQRLRTYNINNCGQKELDQTIISPSISFSPIQIHTSLVNHSFECNTCTDKCTNINANNEIIINVDSSNTAVYMVDGTLQNFIDKEVFVVELVNSSGLTLKNQIIVHEITNPANRRSESLFFYFTTPEIGDYTIFIKRYTESNGEYVYNCQYIINFKSCNWYEIHKINCNTYEFYNWANEPITVKSTNYLNNEVKLYTINSLSSSEIVFTDGSYSFEITRGLDVYYETLILFCDLYKCIDETLNKIICVGLCSKDCNNKLTEYNMLVMTLFTFFNFVAEDQSNYFKVLSDLNIKNLQTVSNIYNRLKEYCDDCGTTNDCGCK